MPEPVNQQALALMKIIKSYCNKSKKPNAIDPLSNKSCLSINQAKTEDHGTCYLNSVLLCLVSQIQRISGINFNIDIPAFYSCAPLAPEEDNYVQELKKGMVAANPELWTKASRSLRLLCFILKNRTIKLPVKCSCHPNDLQDPNQRIAEANCKNHCWITVAYALNINVQNGLDGFKKFHDELAKGKPVLCNIDLFRFFNELGEPTIRNLVANGVLTFVMDPDSVVNPAVEKSPLIPVAPLHPDNIWTKGPHVIACIGYDCLVTNPHTYHCYTFKDSYVFANNTPRIFKFCIREDIYAQYILEERSFWSGIGPPLGTGRILNLKVTTPKNLLLSQIEKCCEEEPDSSSSSSSGPGDSSTSSSSSSGSPYIS